VVGLNAAVFTRTGRSEGVGFAIPINQRTKTLVARLTAGEQPGYGYLGIWATALTPNEARLAGLLPGGGVRVWRVESDRPAYRAGLRAGDIILRFDGVQIGNGEQLSRLVYQAIPGSSVALEMLRADCRKSLQVNVGRHRSLEQVALQTDP
jgi:S1-C subfamily serine protease